MIEFLEINNFRSIVQFIRESVASDLSLSQLAIYLTVCSDEGITMPELAQGLNIPQGSLSRNIKRLSRYDEDGIVKGHDLLITTPDTRDRKRLAVYLTERGKALKIELNRLLN